MPLTNRVKLATDGDHPDSDGAAPIHQQPTLRLEPTNAA
jgi:hypothetical protein